MKGIAHGVALSFISLLVTSLLSISSTAVADSTSSAALEAYRRGDYPTAHAVFNAKARDGDAAAQFALGVLYENGQGVQKSYPRARYWYRKSARQGYSRAQNNVGVLHAAGRGGVANYVRAYMWYSVAAAAGNRIAIDNRTGLAQWMRSSQIATAQRLAREFLRRGVSQTSWPYTASRGYTTPRRTLSTVQRRLELLGYEPGPIDGILGPQTVSAIRAFQRDAGMPVDGKVSARLAHQLGLFGATETVDSAH